MSRKYCFFDLDGTLTDSAPGIMRCFRIALDKFGLSEPEDEKLRFIIGPPLVYSFSVGFGLSEEDTTEAIEAYRAEYSVRGYMECTVYDGIREALEKLTDSGVTCALVTSKPAMYAPKVLEHHDLDKYFSCISAPLKDEADPGKAVLIERAKEKLNVQNDENIYMIGDRKYDMEGAKKTGVCAIGVLWGFGDSAELTESGADFIAETPADILKFTEVMQ